MTITFDNPGLAMTALQDFKPSALERPGKPAGNFPARLRSLLRARRQPGLANPEADASAEDVRRNKLEDLREVSLQLEGVLMRQMFASMRKTVQQSQLYRRSRAETMFQEQLHHELVDRMVGAGGLGLGNVIYKRLAGRHMDQPSTTEQPKPTGDQP